MNPIGADLCKLLRGESTFSDVTFQLANGTVFYGHKAIIAARCPYFASAFGLGTAAQFSEADTKVIPVLHTSPRTFHHMMDFIYTDDAHLDQENVWDVLQASEYYLLEGLQEACGEYLCTQMDRRCGETRRWVLDRLPQLWNTACKYGLSSLGCRCRDYACKNFELVVERPGFYELAPSLMEHLLTRDANQLNVSAERKVLHAVMRWALGRMKIELECGGARGEGSWPVHEAPAPNNVAAMLTRGGSLDEQGLPPSTGPCGEPMSQPAAGLQPVESPEGSSQSASNGEDVGSVAADRSPVQRLIAAQAALRRQQAEAARKPLSEQQQQLEALICGLSQPAIDHPGSQAVPTPSGDLAEMATSDLTAPHAQRLHREVGHLLQHIRWELIPPAPPLQSGLPDPLSPLARALADLQPVQGWEELSRYRRLGSRSDFTQPRVTRHTTRLSMDGQLGIRPAAGAVHSASAGLAIGVAAWDMRWVKVCTAKLRRLDLSGCSRLPAAHIRCLRDCPELEWLSLRGCTLADDGAIKAVLRTTVRLQTLILADLPRLTNGIMSAMDELFALRDLSMAGCIQLTDEAFDKVGAYAWGWVWCDAIERVDVRHCPSVTAAGIAKLAQACTNLRELAVGGSGATPGMLSALRYRPGYPLLEMIE